MSKLPRQLSDYLLACTTRFPVGYAVCTVEADVLAFGYPDSRIGEKQRQCHSDVMLTIKPYTNYVVGAGQYATSLSDYVLEISDLSTNKTFWKALATTAGGAWPSPTATTRQLRADGIIRGKLRTPQPPPPGSILSPVVVQPFGQFH